MEQPTFLSLHSMYRWVKAPHFLNTSSNFITPTKFYREIVLFKKNGYNWKDVPPLNSWVIGFVRKAFCYFYDFCLFDNERCGMIENDGNYLLNCSLQEIWRRDELHTFCQITSLECRASDMKTAHQVWPPFISMRLVLYWIFVASLKRLSQRWWWWGGRRRWWRRRRWWTAHQMLVAGFSQRLGIFTDIFIKCMICQVLLNLSCL